MFSCNDTFVGITVHNHEYLLFAISITLALKSADETSGFENKLKQTSETFL